jgi:type I restriction enzyme M protein
MAPHLAEVEKLKLDIIEHKEQLKVLKKEKAADETISTLTETIKALEKSARDAQAKADAIDAAVYDLKAVNPNIVAKVDTRTPEQIIHSIEAQGRIVAEALEKLKTLLIDK